ncbi:rhodanese-like domain-containing protein [Bacillus sp. Marseille-P3661]|uniref:rhodanese-like domain-containing protein n=1 Tax=Bacillus sp. Marseille-P3661 TaxID=1936234 RepID=UPI000C828D14|nr:rhodanese-like domain-containing protein [Bacillus sp. Marseille-P3661]
MSSATLIEEILPDEVSKKAKEGDVSIIDVREHDEVAQGKIPGAFHIPLGEIESRLHEIDKDTEHIMVCRSGNRSGIAAQFLKDKGYKVKNMIGGMLNWKDRVEKD